MVSALDSGASAPGSSPGLGHCVVFLGHFTLMVPLSTQGRVFRKPVNANPGLNVNRSVYFSCIGMFSTSYVLCGLRLFILKTEGQAI